VSAAREVGNVAVSTRVSTPHRFRHSPKRLQVRRRPRALTHAAAELAHRTASSRTCPVSSPTRFLVVLVEGSGAATCRLSGGPSRSDGRAMPAAEKSMSVGGRVCRSSASDQPAGRATAAAGLGAAIAGSPRTLKDTTRLPRAAGMSARALRERPTRRSEAHAARASLNRLWSRSEFEARGAPLIAKRSTDLSHTDTRTTVQRLAILARLDGACRGVFVGLFGASGRIVENLAVLVLALHARQLALDQSSAPCSPCGRCTFGRAG